MPIERRFYLGRLLLSFVLASAVFFSVFFIADLVSYLNYRNTASQNQFIQAALDDLARQLETITCEDSSVASSLERLDHVGEYLSLLEYRFDMRDPRVVREKKLYNQLQLQHLHFIRALNVRCDSQFDILLFFYSNDPSLIDQSEYVGDILKTFKARDPGRYMIYSFDSSLGDESVTQLMTSYPLERVPAVVVHNRTVLYPENINDLLPAFS